MLAPAIQHLGATSAVDFVPQGNGFPTPDPARWA